MNSITTPLRPPNLPPHPLFPFPAFSPPFLSHPLRPRTLTLTLNCSSSSSSPVVDVDMVLGRDGVWSARPQKVAVLWDLDNKPPRGPPYAAALSLRRAASLLGRVVDISAFANRHAFSHLPGWVLTQRRDRRRLDVLERKGLSVPDEPYVCTVCGRKCRTNLDLKRHFMQLHERERQKKLARMRSLKGKKRQRYKERFISGNHKYEEAARELLTPKTGYGLASELRRAGVFVRTVVDKPQAADSALKRQMQHSMARGMDWMVLVSDDSGFADMVKRVRAAELRTVVIGDGWRSLGQHADLWVPWLKVENGEVDEAMLFSGRYVAFDEEFDEDSDEVEIEKGDGLFPYGSFNSEYVSNAIVSDLDGMVDQIVSCNSGVGGVKYSAFTEEEVPLDGEDDLLCDSEEEEDELL